MSTPTFSALGVSIDVADALSARSIVTPFAIQAAVLPDALAGVDILARSPTGSGKTLAYAIPIVERTSRNDRRPGALVLVPQVGAGEAELLVQLDGGQGLEGGADGGRVLGQVDPEAGGGRLPRSLPAVAGLRGALHEAVLRQLPQVPAAVGRRGVHRGRALARRPRTDREQVGQQRGAQRVGQRGQPADVGDLAPVLGSRHRHPFLKESFHI